MKIPGRHGAPRGRWALLMAVTAVLSFAARAQEEQSTQEGRLAASVDGQCGTEQARNSARVPDSPQAQRNSKPHYSKEPIPPRRLSFGERFDIYRHSISNPDSVIGPAFGATLSQANDDPPEWGQGGAGYGRRFGSNYGRMLITRTLRFGIAAADHEDPLFHPSNETTVWRRARYATVHYFIVRTDGGTEMPALSRLGGVYGAAFASNAWYPASHATTGHALLRGTTALLAGVGWNVFREFWPDIKGTLHGHQ
jgi:hypothetical protein